MAPIAIDGWMNQAYRQISTTRGHITDCKLVVCMSNCYIEHQQDVINGSTTRPQSNHAIRLIMIYLEMSVLQSLLFQSLTAVQHRKEETQVIYFFEQ